MNIVLTESQFKFLMEDISSDVKEDIYLKKDTEKKKLVIFSDEKDEASRRNETIKLKNEFKKLGFRWDGRAWVGDYSKLNDINVLIKRHNKTREIVNDIEKLEDFIENDENLPADKKKELITKIEMYISDLANATDAKAMDAAIRNYLSFSSKFYSYSPHNALLIWLQKRDATRVATYITWQKKFSRGVKKGATRIAIYVPLTKKQVDDTGREENKLLGFKIGYVFDISDTYPLNEKGEIPSVPKWFDENTPSDTANELIGKLTVVAQNLGIKLTKENAKDGEKGYSAGGHINLSSDIAGVYEASVLVHELAHELLHWKTKSPFYIEDPEFNTAEMRELQAESVAYVVLKYYNLPVEHHPTYLVLWKANKEKIMTNLDIIQKCAKFIITKLDGVKTTEEDSELEDIES